MFSIYVGSGFQCQRRVLLGSLLFKVRKSGGIGDYLPCGLMRFHVFAFAFVEHGCIIFRSLSSPASIPVSPNLGDTRKGDT